MRRSFRIPMRFKIMTALLLLVTAVVSAISFTMANLFHTDKSRYITDVSALVARHAAEEATVIIEGYRGRLDTYAHVATDSTLDTRARNTLLKKLVADLPELVVLTIYEDGDRVGTLYDGDRLAAAGLSREAVEAYLDRHPIPAGGIEDGRALVENATLSGKLPAFRMAVSPSISGTAPNTVVEALFDLDPLLNVSARAQVFHVSLVDHDGVVISDRDHKVVTDRTRWDWVPNADARTVAEAREITRDGTPMIAGFASSRLGGLTAVAQVPESVAYFASRELLGQLTFVSLILLVITAIAGLVWSRGLTRPIARLMRATGEIGKGRFDVKVEATSSDEIGTLAESFNSMAGELHTREEALKEAQVQLIHSEKMAAFGQLGAGFAHEIKNPLAGILGVVQVFQRQAQPGTPLFDGLGMVEKETKRCKNIIDNLLRFARQEKVVHEPTDVGRVVADTAALLRHQLEINHVTFEVRTDPALREIMGNANQLQQVLMNLVINAQHALKGVENAKVELSALLERDDVVIRVRDNGPGIPKEIQRRIFEPFFTTKPAGEGTGLGLSVSFGIVKDHNGTIAVESAPGRGTCFVITLPDSAAVADTGDGPGALPKAA